MFRATHWIWLLPEILIVSSAGLHSLISISRIIFQWSVHWGSPNRPRLFLLFQSGNYGLLIPLPSSVTQLTVICFFTRQITLKCSSCIFMIPCEHCWIVMLLTGQNKFALDPLLHRRLTKLGMQSRKNGGRKGVGELRKHPLTWLFFVPREIAWHIWWIKLVRNIIGVLLMISAMIKFQQSRYCHITPLLFNLHWLPVKFRIPFKIILITFKALKRLAPAYVASLIATSPPRCNLRSSRDRLLLSCTKKLS